MLCLAFKKKSRIEDQIKFALSAEVDTLKQNLERSEQELGRAKKQLEDNDGKKYLVFKYI